MIPCAKVLYSLFCGYLYALVYSIARYFAAIPMQEFGDYSNQGFGCYWYWGGHLLFLCTVSLRVLNRMLALIPTL